MNAIVRNGNAMLRSLTLCLAALCLTLPVQAQEDGGPVRTYLLELGGSYSAYASNTVYPDPEDGSGLFGVFVTSRPAIDAWRFDLGRESRFDENGFTYGVTYTRFLPRDFRVWAGLGSGTSEALASEYRASVGVGKGLFPGFMLDAGYTRMQSYEENYADLFVLGYTWYIGAHVITSAGWHYDIGHPGDTVSQALDVSLSVGVWRKYYVGAGYRFGDVSYQLAPFGPGTQVDYEEDSLFFTLTGYLRDDMGLNFKLDFSENEFYEVYSYTLSFFKEW